MADELRVAITGSSGLIGTTLATSLERDGHAVLRLVRHQAGQGEARWNPETGTIDAGALEGVDAVVNLAGENIAQRWTDAARRRIRGSRVKGTTLIANTLAGLARKPAVLVNASAVGYYGDRDDEVLTEGSPAGTGFLAEVGAAWEAAATPAAEAGIRTVLTRFGIVLSGEGGMLPRILTPFRLGLGGQLGDGRQWFSWIALTDLVDAIRFAITDPRLSGPVNCVAPNPVRNSDFTRVLGEVLHRPTLIPVPKFAMQAAMGEMADELLFSSERVIPEKLTATGFQFRYPEVRAALEAELARG